ncbi:hypothetical protein ACFO5Q_11860 [Kordiimonas lipolytica]|uniref:Uncharacterized protein n=1 Tax=Kordiimonas lipolytica TaxID=1662421 RepID=A0ABV8UDJ7_9PROT|nr:hypothetical protein [Kordiimonas lipolytica]
MSEQESEIEDTGSIVGGLITWVLVAIVFAVITGSGVSWGPWALAGWVALLALDFIQAWLRQTKLYVRILSEVWSLPF